LLFSKILPPEATTARIGTRVGILPRQRRPKALDGPEDGTPFKVSGLMQGMVAFPERLG
jgi:hypothetical protein